MTGDFLCGASAKIEFRLQASAGQRDCGSRIRWEIDDITSPLCPIKTKNSEKFHDSLIIFVKSPISVAKLSSVLGSASLSLFEVWGDRFTWKF